jgi:hypothetical protein
MISPRILSLAGAVAGVVVFWSACGGATPRFPPDISASLASTPMRRMETERLYLYYPAARREEALRVAARLEGCAAALHQRTRIKSGYTQAKMVVVMPDFAFNNAFVSGPGGGQEPYSVIPTFNTFDFSTELGLPADPSYVGCHEIVHYVHLLQVGGPWRWINAIFGDVVTPHAGLDSWFTEGLATFYESRLQPGVGRMAWPMWRGMFHAGVAGEPIEGGDLSTFMRASQWGNHYHVGSFFIEFLVERYGEEKLWRFIGVQGRSFFFPLWVSLRFQAVYGKTLSALIDEFGQWTAERFPPRPRPASQRRMRRLGLNARYARALGGTEAVITNDLDAPARLLVHDRGGKLMRTHHLADVVPPRMLTTGSPALVSGMSFTADGRKLYFTVADQGTTFEIARLVEYDVASGAMRVAHHDLGGLGGSIASSGGRYFFSRAEGDRMDLAVLDLATRRVSPLVRAEPGSYILNPRPSPDDTRIVASVFDPEHGFQIHLFDATSGADLGRVSMDGVRANDASFADDGRLVFLAEHEGRFQVVVHDLAAGATTRVSDAPYLAFAPQARAGSVRFLNRDGWGWTLDETALPPPVPAAPVLAEPAPAAATPAVPTVPEPTAATRTESVEPAEPAPTASVPAEPASAEPPPVPAEFVPAGSPPVLAEASPPAATAASIAPGAIAARTLAAPVSAEPRIQSDEPYSQLDHLFVPQLRALAAVTVDGGSLLGLALSGADRLSFHNWSATVLYHPASKLSSGAISYVNTQLAPVTIAASASRLAWQIEGEDAAGAEIIEDRVQSDASLFASRTLRGSTSVALGVVATSDERPDSTAPLLKHRRMAGASLALDYAGVEATPYGGRRRALLLSTHAAFYPEQVSNLEQTFTDVRGELGITLPLPLSRRHALDLSVRGRQLVGAEGQSLLQVGGFGLLAPLLQLDNGADPPDFDADILPPAIRFAEVLRGFEDYAIGVDRVAIGDLRYRYPFIIDRGFASTLWLFPALFFRQIDVELFAAAALDQIEDLDQRLHAAAGGAVSLDLSLWLLPLTVRYQIARRLTDDEALVQDVGLGIGF